MLVSNKKSFLFLPKLAEPTTCIVGIQMPVRSPNLEDYYNKQETDDLLAGKLSTSELDDAIDKALLEAKESGDFKPIKGEDYFTEEEKVEFVEDITPAIKDKVEEIIGDVDLDGNATSIDYTSDTATTHNVKNVNDALDKLLNKVYYSAVSISSFTGGGTYEVGTAISSVSFSWKLNKNPLSIAIMQGSSVVVDDLMVDSRSYTYTPATVIKSNTTFTLACGDVIDAGAATTRTASTSLSFLYKLFYNTITGNTPSTQNEIQAMGVGGNMTKTHWSNSKTITHAFKGKKFCIALPSSMKISKAVTSNNETITFRFVAGEEIDYTIGTTKTKYKVHTFEVAAEMDVTLTITLA